MDKKNTSPMTPFDNLVTPPELQTLKLLIPYTPSANQRVLAVLVKFMELQSTIRFFGNYPADLHTQAFERQINSPASMLEELEPYLPKKDAEMMASMKNMMNMMEMFQSAQTVDSGTDNNGTGGFDPMDMMKGMLTPEQQNMFDMYSTMFSQELNQDKKGDDTHERMDEPPGHEEY